MSKHSSGPWHAAPTSEKTWNVGIYDADGSLLATIKVASKREADRRKADASLMAAAPEMLMLLRLAQHASGSPLMAARCAALVSSLDGETS